MRRYAALNTKIKGMERRLLNDDAFMNLLSKHTTAEAITYLKTFETYKKLLKDIDSKKFEISEVELLLLKNIARNYEKILCYETDAYKKLGRIFLLRFEVSDIKVLIKTAIKGKEMSTVRHAIISNGRYTKINFEKLLQSRNMEELIENMKDTDYYKILKPYMEELVERRFFYMEMALDKYYFGKMVRQSTKLEDEDKQVFSKFLGINIDLLNLQWLYRSRELYELMPEEVFNYALPGGHVFKDEDIKKMSYQANIEDVIEHIKKSKYGFLFDDTETREIFMERRIKQYQYFQLQGYKKKERFNIMESIVYLHLLEFEMRDIIASLEANKYGLPLHRKKQFLIRKL